MSDRDDARRIDLLTRGLRDGEHNVHRPPHDRGVVSEILFGYSKQEHADRRAYNAGWRRGKGRG